MSVMAKITRIETILVDLPTIRPHVLAMATMHRQTLCLLRLHCSDGIVGLGEATTIGGLAYGPEAPETIKTAIDTYFAPLLEGADAMRPVAAMALLDRHVVGNHFAKCAVETALLDAQGQRVGVAVSELLGGRRVKPAGALDIGQRGYGARHCGGRGDDRPAAAQHLQAEDRQARCAR
jgi:muconate cycloisomerase